MNGSRLVNVLISSTLKVVTITVAQTHRWRKNSVIQLLWEAVFILISSFGYPVKRLLMFRVEMAWRGISIDGLSLITSIEFNDGSTLKLPLIMHRSPPPSQTLSTEQMGLSNRAIWVPPILLAIPTNKRKGFLYRDIERRFVGQFYDSILDKKTSLNLRSKSWTQPALLWPSSIYPFQTGLPVNYFTLT